MLQGDQFDGAMNYKYFSSSRPSSFFAKKQISTDEFVERAQERLLDARQARRCSTSSTRTTRRASSRRPAATGTASVPRRSSR